MRLDDTIRLVQAIRDTADVLRDEADIVGDLTEAAFLRRSAEACDRRAAEMERELPEGALLRASGQEILNHPVTRT